ncbi:signal peptidase I [Candidatus Berkelbacteria bacterium]|nr:signal peptidase I [Candidatus Berkelbacteria bacterium]
MRTIPSPYTGKSPESAYETLRTIVLVLLAAFLVRSFIAQPFVVQGRSMEPTFHHQDYLVVDKITYRLKNPRRGDIIVFKSPEEPTQNYIKRIIGLPGETVIVKNETITINGQTLNEPYIETITAQDKLTRSPSTFLMEQTLNENEYFVMGDNRDHSSDSRRWGPLPEQNILGRAMVTVLPFSDFELLKTPDY